MMFGHSSQTNQQLPSNAATSLWQSNQTSRNQVAPQWPNQSTPQLWNSPPLSTSSVHLGNQGAFGGSVMQPAVQEQFQEGFTQQSDQNNYFSL